jgi:hypothetical protein
MLMSSSAPRYGIINFDMMKTWFGRAPEADGPFWALNLMKYREVADYGDTSGPAISGREADDIYVPRDSLAGIGAMIVLGADVATQNHNEPAWDRIGIVRYPTRTAFLEMQQRDDFKQQHVHKDAGMEFTIVMSCLPDTAQPPVAAEDGTLVLRVARLVPGSHLASIEGATRVATFGVEGVIVGDERAWSHVAFDLAPTPDVAAALLSADPGAEEIYGFELNKIAVNRLVESIETAPANGVQL